MINAIFLFFAITVFVAVVLGIEGGYNWWNARHGPEAKRLEERLRAASAGGHAAKELTILKQRALSSSEGLQKLLLKMPRVHTLDRLIVQSGATFSVGNLFSMMLILGLVGLLGSIFTGRGLPIGIFFALALGSLPIFYVLRARTRRMARIETQLPDAIDLMGRAMRAGHAFPTALSMVGEEMSDPIGGEFKILFDEVNYGVTLEDALLNLLERVPSTDLKFFVVALLLQRETGGNLAELLDNISAIVRSRIKLMGEVRTLSAEGKLSAWILSALPFVVALVINIVSPGFMSVLWGDPVGLKMIYGALFMMLFGVWWMSRIIKIRV